MSIVHRNFSVRGQVFATTMECADYFGLCQGHVRAYLRSGRADMIGIRRTGQERMQVVVRGQVFEDVFACAAHFGITTHAVYSQLSMGRPDSIGLGKRRPGRKGNRRKPITIGPLSFESYAAASLSLGFCVEYVSRAVRAEQGYSMERVLAAAMALAAKRRQDAMAAAKRRDDAELREALAA
jgi:hypothetical protein